MNPRSLWVKLLGVECAVLERVEEEDEAVIAGVRVGWRDRGRCSHCGRRCPQYDRGSGPARWRTLDLGTTRGYVEASVPRVTCPEHGVVTSAVPWARRSSRFTRAFEDQVAWLAVHTDRTTVASLMRISWSTVGRIVERVSAEAQAGFDPFENLRNIGIDEISYRKGHRYLMVVVDHDTDRLLWAMPGRDTKTVDAFFDLLGEERCRKIERISADAGGWIETAVKHRCPQAVRCMDPFHVVQWATDALDKVRRTLWNELRKTGNKLLAESLKRSRYALWKNPENLTERQRDKLAVIEKVNRPLYRAYLLKEQLREVFQLPPQVTRPETKWRIARESLHAWCAWAARSRLQPFVDLGRRIRKHQHAIAAAIQHGLSNARVEAANTKLRLLHRLAFGFHRPESMIALAMLRLGGLCPPLPGRLRPTNA